MAVNVPTDTKIVCTIGPATHSDEMLRGLMREGMAVARLNFSHGTHEWHGDVYIRLRRIADEEGIPLAILQDLSGPKLRIGNFIEGRVFLTPGEPFRLTEATATGDASQVSVPFKQLGELGAVTPRLLLADGMIELEVTGGTPDYVDTVVRVGGWLASRQGICFPGQPLPLQTITDKDRKDLAFGLNLGVDFVALSFVRAAQDIRELKALVASAHSTAAVIAKLERPEALAALDEILHEADGVMVARGDMGVEMPPEKVPLAQKRIIRSAREAGKYVITATQMLESMVHSPWPTRAEVSDVANAVLDGTDAVMLSGETAAGEYPLRVVEMMRRIARETETEPLSPLPSTSSRHWGSPEAALSLAAAGLATGSNAKGIVAYTRTGATARLISRSMPGIPVYAITPFKRIARQLNLARGVRPLVCEEAQSFEHMLEVVNAALLSSQPGLAGEMVVIAAGFPIAPPWGSNCLLLHQLPRG
jgi:pyruvate kinase